MLKKSSKSPHGRLLSLFEILEDWLNAPNIAEQIMIKAVVPTSHLLQDYLTIEAAKAGAIMPEMLASQLYFMAIAATQEKLHAGLNQAHLSHASLSHAKNAARALIKAQTKKEFHISKPSTYAIAACFTGVLVVAGGLFFMQVNQAKITPPSQVAASQATALQQPSLVNASLMTRAETVASAGLIARPEQTAALMAQIELMRHGNCQLIEAIQLPDSQKGIYLNIVVNGQVSTDPYEQKIAMELIKKTRCSYTPMLMANSKS